MHFLVSQIKEPESDSLALSQGIKSTFHENIQNLEPDLKNWGCARTGFTYKRREPDRSSFPNPEPQRNLVPIDPIMSNCLVDSQVLDQIQDEKNRLRRRLDEISEQIRLQKKQL